MTLTPKVWVDRDPVTRISPTPISAAALVDVEQRMSAYSDSLSSLGWVNVKSAPYLATGNGTTNDRVAIQAALDSGAKVVYLPPGTYLIGVNALTIPSNVVLLGAGWDSILKVSSSPALYPLYIAPGTNDVLLRNFAINGNKAAISGDPDAGVDPPACAVQVGGESPSTPCHRINVENVYVHDCFTMGFSFQNVEDSHVYARIEGNQRDGCTFYFNCRGIHVDLDVVDCADDHLGINSGDGAIVGMCERITGEIRAVGPSTRNKGRAVTIRGGKHIDLRVRAYDMSQSAVVIHNWDTTSVDDVKLDLQIDGAGGVADKDGVRIELQEGVGAHIRDVRINGQIRNVSQDGIRINNVRAVRADDDVRDITIDCQIDGAAQDGIAIDATGINDVRVAKTTRVRGCGGWGFITNAVNKRIHVDGDYRQNANGVKMRLNVDSSCRAHIRSNTGEGFNTFGLSGVAEIAPIVSGNGTNYTNDGGHTATFVRPYRTLVATTTWDPPNIVNDTSTSSTFTVTGAAPGDPAVVSFDNAFLAGTVLNAQVTTTDTVTVTIANLSGADKNFGNGTLRIEVRKYL